MITLGWNFWGLPQDTTIRALRICARGRVSSYSIVTGALECMEELFRVGWWLRNRDVDWNQCEWRCDESHWFIAVYLNRKAEWKASHS